MFIMVKERVVQGNSVQPCLLEKLCLHTNLQRKGNAILNIKFIDIERKLYAPLAGKMLTVNRQHLRSRQNIFGKTKIVI